jgi:hypothetical protein
MACLFDHNWSWPRRRGGKDVQVCPNCGAERESKIDFAGPRYRRTQDAMRNLSPTPFEIEASTMADEAGGFTSLAA